MTDREINLVIAEWRGWKIEPLSAPDGSRYGYPPNGLPKTSSAVETIPDYCRDLNAIHDAESKLEGHQRDDYQMTVIESTHGPNWRFDIIHMNAKERAECLVKVISRKPPSASGS